jgi:hypothetical protein
VTGCQSFSYNGASVWYVVPRTLASGCETAC